jgi:ABC-type lipoprotein release transport system permease subunit
VLALGASKVFSAQVVIDPFDRFAYFGGMALVLAACVCAAYFPARHAARVDPVTTLRYD